MDEQKVREELKEWGKAILIGVVLVWIIKSFLFVPIKVDGESMLPTLEHEDRLILDKIVPALKDYNRFDVIVFEASKNVYYVKRIIGVAGDTIEYKDDVLYINGKAYDEPYLEETKAELKKNHDNTNLTYDFKLEELLGEQKVPEGYYFVLGDNRRHSTDSRDVRVGFVKEEVIQGKAEFILYPFSNIKSLH